MIRLEMKKYNMILTEKQKISALSSGKIDKYEYLTGEETLSSNQRLILEHCIISFMKSFWKINRKGCCFKVPRPLYKKDKLKQIEKYFQKKCWINN